MMRYLGGVIQRLFRSDLSRVMQSSAMSTSSKIAVCQMTSVADKAVNFNTVKDLVKNAVGQNVQMIFFPEACDYMSEKKEDIVKNAEPLLTGETMKKYRELAANHSVWLSMGGIHELDEKNSKTYNTHVLIDNNGEIVQAYRKLHLFDVEIPEKNLRLKESDYCSPGSHIVSPVETPVGKVGLAVCYDLRFPELSTALSILDCDVLTYPSAFTHATGLAHWHILLRARAIENQCYVVAAAQVGQHNAKRRSFGHALVVNPWGEVLVDLGGEAPGAGVADIARRELGAVRGDMPVFRHRRKDVYSLHALSLRKTLLPEHGGPSSAGHRTDAPEVAGPCLAFGHVKVPETCVFYKTELCYAFVNLRCVTPGHVLVAPIRLVDRNLDLTEEEAADFYRSVRLVQKLMERVHNTRSCTVTIQDGEHAGQTVRHLHCHVMPRTKGDFIENDLIYLELAKHDNFKCGHPSKPARTREEMETEAAMLRKEMEKLIRQENTAATA